MRPLLPSRAYITSEINRLLSILSISSYNMIEICFEMLKYSEIMTLFRLLTPNLLDCSEVF